jgi:hypothetical protein
MCATTSSHLPSVLETIQRTYDGAAADLHRRAALRAGRILAALIPDEPGVGDLLAHLELGGGGDTIAPPSRR